MEGSRGRRGESVGGDQEGFLEEEDLKLGLTDRGAWSAPTAVPMVLFSEE